ncbi:hypothetical protein AOCH_006181 [Aspergillus ochraceoroseus]|uniref:Urea transporter (Dur3) n=1 Tax=Aspergillus ochraceoroseus TaxID=138278 RepID=A0A0F8VH32_9EURO|nr:hypothetical protein AOCH_006181 [Aspergillus ochraceoroseus]
MADSVTFQAPLSQGFGYGIIIGLGFAFALTMIFITWALKRYQHEVITSEMFSTAGRTVKSGLVASAVVSSWTWAATLLQSSAVAYQYGTSGPFFYASGATVQIILFATLAIELKRRAPNAHTFLEAIRARYGTAVHVVFIVFCLMTNILVTAMLLTGGSAVLTSMTGVPTVAACFLLPIGVVIYTLFGGIKATFITDYMHTVVIIVIIFIFSFSAYATHDKLGSPGKEGGIFWVINIVGNFGTVFLDNGYYNKAIAAHPVHAFPGSCLGGYSPHQLDGRHRRLVLPFAAVELLGYSGAVCTTLMVFMAVTSAFSAQLIAVSSILTYDIYQAYINPAAKGQRLVWVSHLSCILFAVVMASFATGLYYAGIGMGYLYLLMGVIISSAVFPGAMALIWKGQNWIAAAASPVLGLAMSLIAWLTTTKSQYGTFTVQTTGSNYPMLAGNVAALLSPLVFSPLLTYLFGPQNYDYESMRAIRKVDDSDVAAAAHVHIDLIPGETLSAAQEQEEIAKLNQAAVLSRALTVSMVVCFLLLWPIPMYGSSYVFSKEFFTGWVVVGIIWLFGSAFGVVVFPLWEGRESMVRIVRLMALDAMGRKKQQDALDGDKSHEETTSGVITPTEKVMLKSDTTV